MERQTAFNRIIASNLTAEEKGLLRGLLTKPEVVDVINLGNVQPSDDDLRGIMRANFEKINSCLLFKEQQF